MGHIENAMNHSPRPPPIVGVEAPNLALVDPVLPCATPGLPGHVRMHPRDLPSGATLSVVLNLANPHHLATLAMVSRPAAETSLASPLFKRDSRRLGIAALRV